jgi:hypothetical protein
MTIAMNHEVLVLSVFGVGAGLSMIAQLLCALFLAIFTFGKRRRNEVISKP